MDKNADFSQFMRLAQSEEGQMLWKLLQRSDPGCLREAVTAASGGDWEAAKGALCALLKSPEAEALRKRMEETL